MYPCTTQTHTRASQQLQDLKSRCFGLRGPFGALTWCIYTKEEHHAVSHNTAPSCHWHNVSLKMETLKKNPYGVCPAVFCCCCLNVLLITSESLLSVVLRSHAALVISVRKAFLVRVSVEENLFLEQPMGIDTYREVFD